MKNVLLPLLFCAFCAPLFAQTQVGLVREQNSKRRPLGGVQVNFADAVPGNSDDNGNFRLVFRDKKAGDFIFFEEIRKSGYELVNKKDLEFLKISSADRLGEDIILAKAGVVEAAKKEYYGISDQALLAGFEREKKVLREKLQKAQVNKKEFEDQLTDLQQQYDLQKGNLDALADKFARVNFDDVDTLYRPALELFKAGDIEGCKQKLENLNLLARTKKALQKRKIFADATAENEKGIQVSIKGLKLQTQTYLLTFEFGKAEEVYDQLLQLDSTDLEILQDAADFYSTNHRYDKALRTYPLVAAHPKAEAWQVANAYSFMGNMLTATGNLPAALDAYTQYFEAYEKLHRGKPDDAFYKNGLAISYQYLGITHTALGNLDKALAFFEDQTKLFEELYAAYPKNVDFKNGLAISYEKLGETHTALGNLDKALAFFEDETKLFEELYAAYPQNVDFKNLLAISYQFLGITHAELGNLDKAFTFFEDYNKLEKELYAAYPKNVDFKNNLAISYQYLGATHTTLGNLDKALTFFEERSRLGKELYAAYPKNVNFKNGLAISYSKLGDTHTALGNLDKALTFFEERSRLGKELYAAYLKNVNFKNGLAISYEKLGDTHTALGNLDKALTFFEDYNKLEKELYAAYPTNVDFKHNLAISYSKLGDTHTTLGNLDKALAFFEDYNKLEKELYAAYPKNVAFKKGLAISYAKLGGLNAIRKEWDKAKIYYDDYYQLVFELNTAYPTNVNFINGVAISHAKLGMTVLALGDITTAHKEFAISKSLFGKLYKDTPSSIYFQANYAQATAVSKAIEIIAKKEINTAEIMEGKAIFDKINSQSKNLDYQKRAAIIEKMLQPGSDLNALVIEISMFTL